jgi:hypothetical protein
MENTESEMNEYLVELVNISRVTEKLKNSEEQI